jgi:hypothetical protein
MLRLAPDIPGDVAESIRKRGSNSTALWFCAWLVLSAIALYGLYLRTRIIFTDSLWIDEISTLVRAKCPLFKPFFLRSWSSGVQTTEPPLGFLLFKMFHALFGLDGLRMRIVPLVWSILSFPCLFATCRRVERSGILALISVLLLSVSPMHVLFAMEIRYYSMLFLMSALLLHLVLRIASGASRKDWVFLFLLSLAMVYTSFLSGILLFSIFIALLPFAKTLRRAIMIYLVVQCIVFVLFFPFVLFVMKQFPVVPPGSSSLSGTLATVFSYFSGNALAAGQQPLGFLGWAYLVAVLVGIGFAFLHNRLMAVLLLAWILNILPLHYLIAHRGYFLCSRLFIHILPAIVIATAYCFWGTLVYLPHRMRSLPEKASRAIGATLSLPLLALVLWNQSLETRQLNLVGFGSKSFDFCRIAEFIKRNRSDGDVVTYSSKASGWHFAYFFPDYLSDPSRTSDPLDSGRNVWYVRNNRFPVAKPSVGEETRSVSFSFGWTGEVVYLTNAKGFDKADFTRRIRMVENGFLVADHFSRLYATGNAEEAFAMVGDFMKSASAFHRYKLCIAMQARLRGIALRTGDPEVRRQMLEASAEYFRMERKLSHGRVRSDNLISYLDTMNLLGKTEEALREFLYYYHRLPEARCDLARCGAKLYNAKGKHSRALNLMLDALLRAKDKKECEPLLKDLVRQIETHFLPKEPDGQDVAK